MINKWQIHILKKKKEKKDFQKTRVSTRLKKSDEVFSMRHEMDSAELRFRHYENKRSREKGGMKSRLLTRNECETGHD